jgi:hypothetical protein
MTTVAVGAFDKVDAHYFRSTRKPNSRRDRIDTGGSLPPSVVGMEPFELGVETSALATRVGFGGGNRRCL